MAIGTRLRGIMEEMFSTSETPEHLAAELRIDRGYPKEVAERIAYGELDMRPEAVSERLLDFTSGDNTTYFHGGYMPAQQFRGEGDLTFMTPNPLLANTYIPNGRGLGQEPLSGQLYPLVVDGRDFLYTDARGDNWGNIELNDIFDDAGNVLARAQEGRYYETDGLGTLARHNNYPGIVIDNVVDIGSNVRQAYKSLENADHPLLNKFPSIEDSSTVLAVNDPTKIRSRFAAFDPEYKGDNLMGFQGSSSQPSVASAIGNSAIGAAGMAADSPEDELHEGLTDKMVDYLTEQMGGSEEDRERAEYISMGMDFLPFIGAAKGVSETYDAFKNDDTLGMALGGAGILASIIPFGKAGLDAAVGVVKDIPEVTRDTGLLQRVGDVDLVNAMKVEGTEGPALIPNQKLQAQDLEGRGYVSTMADTSSGDLFNIENINGIPVQTTRFGGVTYMRNPANGLMERVWASDEGQISGVMNAARQAQELSGTSRSPIMMPYGMGPHSTDFYTGTGDIMTQVARQNTTKKAARALDKQIREGAGKVAGVPDFPGLLSPDLDSWMRNAGGDRKKVTKAIDDFREDTGITLSEARAALVDPDQMNPRVGDLRTAGIIDLVKGSAPGMHPSYNTDLYGQFLGTFEGTPNLIDMPGFGAMKRSTLEDFVQLMSDRGHDLSASKLPAPVGKAMQGGLIGTFDQQLLDELIRGGFIDP